MRDESRLGTPKNLSAPVPNFQCILHTSSAQRGLELVHPVPDGGQRVSYHEINQGRPRRQFPSLYQWTMSRMLVCLPLWKETRVIGWEWFTGETYIEQRRTPESMHFNFWNKIYRKL